MRTGTEALPRAAASADPMEAVRKKIIDDVRARPPTAEDAIVLHALAPHTAPAEGAAGEGWRSTSGQSDVAHAPSDPVVEPAAHGQAAHGVGRGRESFSSSGSSSDGGEFAFPEGGISVEAMEAILRDTRITTETTTDYVCHNILKPATVPSNFMEIVTPKTMFWGTLYQATYQNLEPGEKQDAPPEGTFSFSERLLNDGHSGSGIANVFFSHAWKFKVLLVLPGSCCVCACC